MATTPRGYRYPLSSDAFNPPLDIGNLAADVDADVTTIAAEVSAFPRSKHGGGTVNTSASGYFTVTHGLGFVPTAVFIQSRSINTSGHNFVVSAQTSTTFTARAYYADVPENATSISIFWEVRA